MCEASERVRMSFIGFHHRSIRPWVAVKWIAHLCAFACVGAFGQGPQPAAFQAASVKPAASDSPVRSSMRGGPGTNDAGQITFTNITLTSVLLRAYDVKSFQLHGPEWLSSRRYNIAAK